MIIVLQFLSVIVTLCVAATAGFAQDATTPGILESYSTIYSIGVEWNLAGDKNHNARCGVLYREVGEAEWKKAMPLFRVDMPMAWYGGTTPANAYRSDGPFNMFAGSVMFLNPGASYEVKLDLQDPDGGSRAELLVVKTQPLPALPTGGATYHAVPGAGGGEGSIANPFKGLAAAQARANPGDVILIHKGHYGSFVFNKPGKAGGKYLAWKGAGDGDVLFSNISVDGSYVWLEGLTITSQPGGKIGIARTGRADNVVLTRNTILGFNYSIALSDECSNWYIVDNVIVGDMANADVSKIGGEGVELNKGCGHTVAHNSISHTADGVSSGHRNIDIFGNDIFDVTDDGIEPDFGYANIRVWDNRITDSYNAGFSFQCMYGAPWYFIRNQVITTEICKFRITDRFVLANNTFVSWVWVQPFAQMLFTGTIKNNLWIWAGGRWGGIWHAERNELLPGQSPPPVGYTPDWRTDVDYNGFDWGTGGGECLANPFVWDTGPRGARTAYPDIQSFSKAFGVEQHGVRVERDKIFESFTGVSFNKHNGRGKVAVQYMTLKPGCNAIDAGVAMPNINDGYTGKAPDLGAYEFGKPLPHFGPRHLPVQGGEPAH